MSTLFGMPNLLRSYVLDCYNSGETKIRVHGNGFLQLDIDKDTRLHFWGDPRIPKQKVDSGWHDHTFTFFSSVLKGQLKHISYKVVSDPCGGFEGYRATPREGSDTKLEKVGRRFNLYVDEMLTINEGESYGFAQFKTHYSTTDKPTITLMKKMPEAKGMSFPVVYCPVGLEPDNTFNRHGFDQELLYRIAFDIIGRER